MRSLSMSPFLLVSLLVESANASVNSNVGVEREMAIEQEFGVCPPCDTVFSMVGFSAEGERVQDIEMQERGEPKSGTGFMFQWARKALDGTCEYLRRTYGRDTCHSGQSDDHPAMNHTLIFEPRLGGDYAKCVCKGIDRVRINLSQHHKHLLPVSKECRWYHSGGFPKIGSGCKTVAGRPVQNYADLAGCVQEAQCEINDDRSQLALIRDPRAVAVSTYFHFIRFHHADELPKEGRSINENVLALLPEICQWVAVRHMLFEGQLNDRSTLFWYDQAQDDPVEWHNRLLASVGVRLPASEVSVMADAATHRGKLNAHPGGAEAVTTRSWKDEVDPEFWDEVDSVVRLWLPPAVLSRIGL